MPNTQTVEVPHLGGITTAYQTSSNGIDKSKPTLILINSFTTSSELYRDAFHNEDLTSVMNLLAIELLGHGQTRAKVENWTYWDTAIMNLQVMEKLGIDMAFVLGTSQGGWVTVRMALLASEKVCPHVRITCILCTTCLGY
jgi:pimeloyl-ACP methyl ester carboxylesterase